MMQITTQARRDGNETVSIAVNGKEVMSGVISSDYADSIFIPLINEIRKTAYTVDLGELSKLKYEYRQRVHAK